MKTSTTKFLWLAVLGATLSVGFFAYLTLHHYELHYGFSQSSSVCNVNAYISCDAVSASRFSEIFGMPLALLGLLTHIVLLGMLLGYSFKWFDDQERASRTIYYLSLWTALVSVVMAIISFGVLQALCLFCLFTYILAFLNLIFVHLGLEDRRLSLLGRDIGEALTTHKMYLLPIGLILGMTYLLDASMKKRYGADTLNLRVIEIASRMAAAPTKSFDETAGVVKGAGLASPMMTLVEFADFRCPHCKVASSSLSAFATTRPDVKIIIKAFPLDSTCNPQMQQGDGISCHLAFLAHCSESLDKKGWEATHYIFENQETFRTIASKDELTKKVSEKFGFSQDDLKACTTDNATFTAIQSQAKEGDGISGTPAIFINGKLLPALPSLPILNALYERMKSEQRK